MYTEHNPSYQRTIDVEKMMNKSTKIEPDMVEFKEEIFMCFEQSLAVEYEVAVTGLLPG